MTQQEKQLSEKESLDLITSMIHQARNSYHDSGVVAILWGSLIAFCSLVKLSEVQYGRWMPFDVYLLTLVAVIPTVFITIREKRKRRVKTYDDIYLDFLWLAFGICVFLLMLIINIIFRSWAPVAVEYGQLSGQPSSFRFSEFVSPLFLLLYGLPTFVTGAACRFRPMLLGGIFCWICCVVTLFSPMKMDLLLTGFSAIVAWLVPGIIMKRQYRMAKQGLANADV